MIDTKDTSTHEDDQFHFDEFDSHEGEASMEGPSSSAKVAQQENHWDSFGKRNPRKLIFFGAVIAIIIIFIIYHFASSWNNPLDELNKISKVAPPNTQAAIVKLQQPERPEQAPINPVNTEMSNKVSGLNQTLNQQEQTISELQNNMEVLQNSVNSISTTVNEMSQRLTVINDQLTKPKKALVKPIETGPPPVNYIVKAMVPGRAWLQGNHGETLSVSVGSDVATHGTVTQIDLAGGQVFLSDGTVISYDINGN